MSYICPALTIHVFNLPICVHLSLTALSVAMAVGIIINNACCMTSSAAVLPLGQIALVIDAHFRISESNLFNEKSIKKTQKLLKSVRKLA